MPSTRHLERFIAVAEDRIFRKAAARLNISQPPLSLSIQQLEEELGTQLLTRTRRSVELTKAGMVFLDHSRRIVSQLYEAIDITQGVAEGISEYINVGFNPASGYAILPALLRSFREHYKNVSLGIMELGTAEREVALLQKRVDIVLYNVPTVVRPDIRQEVILRERMVAVLPVDHPLSEEASVNLEWLRNETFLVRPSQQDTGHRALVLNACRWSGFIPQDLREVDRLNNALTLVASGFGVTLVPASLDRFKPPGAVFVPILDPNMELHIDCGICCRLNDDRELTNNFIEIAHKFGAEFMQTGPDG